MYRTKKKNSQRTKIIFSGMSILACLLILTGIHFTQANYLDTAVVSAPSVVANDVIVANGAKTLPGATTLTPPPKTAKPADPPLATTANTASTASLPAQVAIRRTLRGKTLYINPAYANRPVAISSQPIAVWYGNWTSDVKSAANALVSAASANGKLAVIATYNIPYRDCGSYSAGGASSSANYRAWIQAMAEGIGKREAIVILEPDALAQMSCLSAANQASRYADLSEAVRIFSDSTNSFVYIDAGNSSWIDAATMAERLKKTNIHLAQGFALNVSNFHTTASSTTYGNQLATITGKNYVVDSSRNGNGPNGTEWCNPAGRALGQRPTTSLTGSVDALLWIKVPGESDGTCNGGPAAGTWWEQYAQELITNAGY